MERKRHSHSLRAREVPRRQDLTLRGQPRPEDRSWAVSCIGSESRPNPGLLVLGRASSLCSQSPERSGFLNNKPAYSQIAQQSPTIAPRARLWLMCRSSAVTEEAQSNRAVLHICEYAGCFFQNMLISHLRKISVSSRTMSNK